MMSRRSLATRLPFVLAAALVAGGLGDPLVETIANTGAVGAGYHDTNHLGALPALLCGVVVTIEIALLRCLAAFHGGDRERVWLSAFADRFSARPPLRDVPYVFVLQLGVVFAIETVEQLLVGGAPERGLTWLGGPVAFGLAVHALIAVVVTLGSAWLTRAIAAALASLVRIAFAWIALPPLRDGAAPLHDRRDGVRAGRRPSAHARRIGGRAPPRRLASA